MLDRCVRLALGGLVSIVSLAAPLPAMAAADAGFGVINPMAIYDARPGQSITHTMVVTLGAGAPAPGTDVVVEASGLGEGLDGAFQALPPAEDESPLSARPFIQSVVPAEFHLEPGQSQVVVATFAVPSKAQGTRYADLYVRSLPKETDAMIQMRTAIHVPVVLTIGTTDEDDSASIDSIHVEPSMDSGQLEAITVARNTGNHHYAPRLELTLFDERGQVVERRAIEATLPSILPTFSRRFATRLNVSRISEGYYMLAQLELPGGAVLASRELRFVKADD